MRLEDIKIILAQPDLQRMGILSEHLQALMAKRRQIDVLIENVEKSIKATKGEIMMSDKEKFEGFKRQLISENEVNYGEEVRAKYGDELVNASNAKLQGLSNEDFDKAFSPKLNAALKGAFESGDPTSDLARQACELHKEWLCFFWPEGLYTKRAHLGLGEMYVSDDRFKAYYDNIAPGLTDFLLDALRVYCEVDKNEN